MRAVAVFPYSREVKLIDVDEPQIARPTEVQQLMSGDTTGRVQR